jgi:hypothetical protein
LFSLPIFLPDDRQLVFKCLVGRHTISFSVASYL